MVDKGKRRAPEAGKAKPGPSKKRRKLSDIPDEDPDVGELDLDVSYEGKVSVASAPRPKRRRFTHNEDEPLLDSDKLPKGWTDLEPDLDPDNVEDQIARCKERIQDKIMPWLFERRLKDFETRKKKKDAMMAKEPGLDWDIVKRLNSLEGTKKYLQEINDPDEEIPNVNAIMQAYRSGKLKLNPGLVTYWSKGKKISEPRPFKFPELIKISETVHEGDKGFWVEGIDGYKPQREMTLTTEAFCHNYEPQTHKVRNSTYMVRMNLSFRVSRKIAKACELEFTDDTGSSVMTLFEADLETIRSYCQEPGQPLPPLPKTVGYCQTIMADGSSSRKRMVALLVNLFNQQKQPMARWDWMFIAVKPGSKESGGGDRLIGPWLRSQLFTGTAPDGSFRLWIHDQKTGFQRIPAWDIVANPPETPLVKFDLEDEE